MVVLMLLSVNVTESDANDNLSPKEKFSNSVNVELLFSAHVEHCVTFLHLQKCGCPWNGVFVLLLRFRTSP